MKRVYMVLLSAVCVLHACVLCAQTAEDRFREKFPFKYEFRVGWAGYPAIDAGNYSHYGCFEAAAPSFSLGSLYASQPVSSYMTGVISGEFCIHFKRWFTLSFLAGFNGMWRRYYDPLENSCSGFERGCVVTLLPQARFNWVNGRSVRLYSSAGLGLSAGSFEGEFNCYPSFQVSPFGITLGRKAFFFAETALGTSWIGGSFGVGYRF